MEKMRIELEVMGHDVQFVSINKADAADHQEKLTDKCSFPLVQDLDGVDVWGLMGGGKDDFYIYDAGGNLVKYLPISGETDVNLSTEEGYASLKNAILEVLP